MSGTTNKKITAVAAPFRWEPSADSDQQRLRSVSIQVAAEVADPYTDPFSGVNYEVDTDVLELARQVNVVGYQALQRGFSH